MSDVVIILGAGASVGAGAPVMSTFLDVARDLYATGKVADEGEHFQCVFRAISGLQAIHSKSAINLTNIEIVFTAFEMAELIGRMPGGTEETEPAKLIGSLKRLISTTLEKTIVYRTLKGGLEPPGHYGRLAELLTKIREKRQHNRTVSVLTFNYDTALDFALALNGHSIDYGFEKEPERSRHTPLIKLHGSLNWASRKDGSGIIPLWPYALLNKTDKMFWMDSKEIRLPYAADLGNWARITRNEEVESEPVIVPPTWKKGHHQLALTSVWKAAANHLKEAQHIFVCGYSLPETDGFFKLLYALGSAGGEPLRNFVVFNPDSNVDQRFFSMLGPGAQGRYRFEQAYFEEAIARVGEILL